MATITTRSGLLAALCVAGATAFAAAPSQYVQERAYCMSGQSQQDRATCLKEAAAAQLERRRGTLANPGENAAQQRENALMRCRPLPEQDRADCVARVNGLGKSSGSVEGGGVLKETTTIVPGEAASAPR